MNLKIGTFNILNTCANYPARRSLILSTINSMNCDIIGIQEVNFSGNNELKELENYNIEYVELFKPMFIPTPDFRIDGNAILIKKEIEIIEKYRLEYTDKGRVAQALKLKKDDIVFIVANTHLDHVHDNIRQSEIREFKDFLKKFEEFPIVCTGDYNFNPDSIPYSIMSWDFRSASTESNGKEPSITYPTPLEGVFPRKSDYACIDYIWMKGNVRSLKAEVFYNCGEGTMWASDHYPIVSDIVIN